MREIKFRAWDKDYKKMITNFLLPESKSFGMHRMAISFTGEVFTFTDWNMAEYDEDEMYNSAKYPSRFKIMQYTGLKDKNGKELYEGDITQDVDTGKTFEIMYQGHMFMRYERKPMYMFYTLDGDCLEVIGNIYENPELIGERHED